MSFGLGLSEADNVAPQVNKCQALLPLLIMAARCILMLRLILRSPSLAAHPPNALHKSCLRTERFITQKWQKAWQKWGRRWSWMRRRSRRRRQTEGSPWADQLANWLTGWLTEWLAVPGQCLVCVWSSSSSSSSSRLSIAFKILSGIVAAVRCLCLWLGGCSKLRRFVPLHRLGMWLRRVSGRCSCALPKYIEWNIYRH